MKSMFFAPLAFAAFSTAAWADGHATGNAENGEGLFKKCKACHEVVDNDGGVIVKGGSNGPNLFALNSRAAGSAEDFKKFGKSLVAAGDAGLIWNEADFVSYVADPKAFLRAYLEDKKARSKMSYKLKDENEAKDIWAFLLSVSPPVEDAETPAPATD